MTYNNEKSITRSGTQNQTPCDYRHLSPIPSQYMSDYIGDLQWNELVTHRDLQYISDLQWHILVTYRDIYKWFTVIYISDFQWHILVTYSDICISQWMLMFMY